MYQEMKRRMKKTVKLRRKNKMSQNTVTLECEITYMFKGCPKPSGWFGCYAKHGYDKIKLTGTASFPLEKGSRIKIEAIEEDYDESSNMSYKCLKIEPLVKNSLGLKRYMFTASEHVSMKQINLLHDTYKKDLIDVLIEDPDKVAKETGIDADIIKELTAVVAPLYHDDGLYQLLENLSAGMVEKIRKSGMDLGQVRSNPYILLERFPTVSFYQADKIALGIGMDAFSPVRVGAGILYLLKEYPDGHSFISLSDDSQFYAFKRALEKKLNVVFEDNNMFGTFLMNLANEPKSPIIVTQMGSDVHLFAKEVRKCEEIVGQSVYMLRGTKLGNEVNDFIRDGISLYEAKKGIKFTKEQRLAIGGAFKNRISIVTGGPGRGKTLVAGCINFLASESKHNTLQIPWRYPVALSPTGKGTARLKSFISDTAPETECCTVARFLVENRIDALKKHSNARTNLALLVDESTMLDLPSASDILDYAASNNCRITFLGDVDQLPPVGLGQVFKDLIETDKVPVFRLTQPMRNGGKILENAEKVTTGNNTLSYDFTEMPFFPFDADNEDALNSIIDQYNDELNDVSEFKELGLCCPVNNGPCGVIAMNMRLQDILCPKTDIACVAIPNAKRNMELITTKGYEIPYTFYGTSTLKTKLRIGDIVMISDNRPDTMLTKYTKDDFFNGDIDEQRAGVFNGDAGRIIAYEPMRKLTNNLTSHHIIVQLTDGYFAAFDMVQDDHKTLQLAYANTIHKMQGSEYETVICVMPTKLDHLNDYTNGFVNRNLLYTAITRAKKRFVLMGSKEAVSVAVNTPVPMRNSMVKAYVK